MSQRRVLSNHWIPPKTEFWLSDQQDGMTDTGMSLQGTQLGD